MNSDQQYQLAKLPKTFKKLKLFFYTFGLSLQLHCPYNIYSCTVYQTLTTLGIVHSTCKTQHCYINRVFPYIPVLVYIQSNSLNTSRQSILKYGNWRYNSLQILDIINAYYSFTFKHHFLYNIFSDLTFLSLYVCVCVC